MNVSNYPNPPSLEVSTIRDGLHLGLGTALLVRHLVVLQLGITFPTTPVLQLPKPNLRACPNHRVHILVERKHQLSQLSGVAIPARMDTVQPM
jgi:hypothetical protein